MSATDSGNTQEQQSALLADARLREGLARIRHSLVARGEPINTTQPNPIKELDEYFYRAVLRLSAASFTLKNCGTLPEPETTILQLDVQLANEIGSLLLNLLGE
jgi:hypothetical protein